MAVAHHDGPLIVQKYFNNVTDRHGNAISGVSVSVKSAAGAAVTIYSDNGTTPITGTLTTDANGYFEFYAADGRYSLTLSSARIGTTTITDVLLEDPADSPAVTLAALAASGGSALVGNGGETVAETFNALQLADYTALRAYAGPRKSVYVTGYLGSAAPSGIAGMFVRDDSDTTSTDDGGTVLVATNGKRWKRRYDGRVSVMWFGVKGDGSTDDTTALQAAINSGKKDLIIPPGTFVHGDLTISAPVRLIGAGRGYGVNQHTAFKYTGSGKAIHVTSAASYVYLEHFSLKNAGTGTDGIFIDGSHVYVTNVGLTDNLNVGFSNAISTGTSGPFDLIFSQVYCQGNGVGLNIPTGITIQAINCWLDQNGTNAIIGSAGYRVHGFSMIGGVNQLLGVGYFGNTSETTTSIGFDVVNAGAFVYDNVYSEANGGGIVGSEGQRSIRIRQCKGAKISAYFYGANRATAAITLDAGAKGIVVSGGYGINIDGYIIEAAAGAVYEVGMIAKVNCLGTIDRAWVPVATSMTVVNGTGGVTYIGNWERVGDRVFFDISVLPTGTATSNAVGNTTYFALDAAMPTPVSAAACNVVDGSVNSLGCGQIFTNGRVYPPTWSARNVRVDISGSYLAAPAT